MSASIDSLIPELQPFARELQRAAGAAGLQPRITSTLRSSQEQARLYRRYLAGLNPFPVAPPGSSSHEYGYAFDMIVSPMDAIRDVGAAWESMGGVWGGAFNDPIHFEYPGFKEPTSAAGAFTVEDRNVIQQAADYLNTPFATFVSFFLPAIYSYRKGTSIADQVAEWLSRQ